MSISAKKNIVLSEAPIDLTTQQVVWDKQKWNEAIFEHGYKVFIERSLECPCGTKGNTTPNPDCINCGGTGRFYIDKTYTVIMCQGMNNQTKFQPFSAENMGVVKITTSPYDKLGYMDKVTLTEVESIFSQRIHLRKNNAGDTLFGFTTYNMIEVYDCYMFQGNSTILKILKVDVDFTIQDNKIILNNKYLNIANPRITVRYLHNPIYFILETNRETIKQKSLVNCATFNTDTPEANFPLSFTGKSAQFLPELLNFDGTGTIDNTDYNRIPINYDYGSNCGPSNTPSNNHIGNNNVYSIEYILNQIRGYVTVQSIISTNIIFDNYFFNVIKEIDAETQVYIADRDFTQLFDAFGRPTGQIVGININFYVGQLLIAKR